MERVARRTAMIGDEGGSLFKYLLSYLQSLLVLSPSTDEMPAKSVPCDVDALGTFDLVSIFPFKNPFIPKFFL